MSKTELSKRLSQLVSSLCPVIGLFRGSAMAIAGENYGIGTILPILILVATSGIVLVNVWQQASKGRR